MSQIPPEQVADSHKLIADARIDLYELTPSGGSGTVRFKNENTVTWRGNLYEGMPVALTGEKKTSDTGLTMPKMVIGQQDIDISAFKPLVFDGYLDNAIIVKMTILLDDLVNNRNIKQTSIYRVKRVEEYSRSKISMQLATLSDSLGFSMPYRQYLPPAFASVQM